MESALLREIDSLKILIESLLTELNHAECDGDVDERVGRKRILRVKIGCRNGIRVGRLGRLLIGLTLILSSLSLANADETIGLRTGLSRIDLADLKKHLTTLASDALEGRECGSRGGKAALAYLRTVVNSLRVNEHVPQVQSQEFGRDYQNLLVFLPGSDEALKHEVIVVGAHYDHVGYGKSTNSHGPIGYIHNGADDNASGTSALLELIDAFTSLPTPPRRPILFAFWDAEEAGLLGSKHWVGHPTLPLKDVRFALNIDMLGRLRDGRLVTVGWRSAPGLREILASHNVSNNLRLAFQPRVNADSDHYHFYASRIPAIHLDTDKHEDYHRPSDDPEKILWDGLLQTTEFAYRIVLDMANRPEVPNFRNDALQEQAPSWLNPRSPTPSPYRIGMNWDEEQAKKKIIRITHISPDSPASQAGIRIRDQLLTLGPWDHGTAEDLKTVMQIAKNPVTVRVAREGSETPVELKVNLRGQPIRLGAAWIEDPALPNCVVITQIHSDAPADRAGIAAGDVILEMGGKPIASSEEMRQRVIEEPGPFRFRIESQGRLRDVVVELFDQPKRTPNDQSQ